MVKGKATRGTSGDYRKRIAACALAQATFHYSLWENTLRHSVLMRTPGQRATVVKSGTASDKATIQKLAS
ncbi:hypothetical protein XELAEV_180164102mg, partial [Xenopus laevis]